MVLVLHWLVIGGGIHGTCVARALHAAGHEARILEPTGGGSSGRVRLLRGDESEGGGD
jgi:2-polyprenyl-6-methoxyphenol hydroxylase-like FAD-dependent oxidoreductase